MTHALDPILLHFPWEETLNISLIPSFLSTRFFCKCLTLSSSLHIIITNKLSGSCPLSWYYSISLFSFRVSLLTNCVLIAASYLMHSLAHYNLVSSPNIPPRVFTKIPSSLQVIKSKRYFSVSISLTFISIEHGSSCLDFLGTGILHLGSPSTSLAAPILSTLAGSFFSSFYDMLNYLKSQ